MARWDTIFSLPIQSPPTFEFSSADLEWTTVEGWSDKMEKVAFIPFDRVDNFLSGESANKDFPTRFYKEAGRKSKSSSSSKEKVDGVLEFTMYRCVFGPDDRREGGTIRPSRNTYVCKKKTAGRPSIKRGCQCYFFVKRLVAKPMAALIIYKQDKHVDKEGLPCHGPQDARSVGTRAGSAPYIIDELLVLLSSLIHIGFSVETIMHIRNEMIEKKQGPFHCDDLVTHRFARRLERNIRRSSYDLDEDDAVSVEMWSSKHENDVFFCEDYSDSQPFVLGIQTEWQLQQMIKYGDNSIMASDSKFGTNKLQYPVHSVLVFDADKKAIPVAWIIAPQSANGDAYKWIRALHRRVRSKKPDWKLAGFVVDDPSADINTIREVFQCSVLISFWRVRHAWHKNLVTKCVDIGMRSEMLGRLGKAVYNICEGNGDVTLFENFMEDFVDCPDFVDYFRAVWFPRLGMWVAALKSLPYASEENCSAMELYHDKLKVVLSDEKNTNVYQRTDWLVDKLFTKAHSCFFLESYQCKEHFAPYKKAKWTSGSTSWGRSLEIPDSDVILEDNRSAKVISRQCREKTYVVLNPGSEFSLCDCSWSEKGNLCKHMIKVSRMCRRQQSSSPSISLFKYNQALMKLLHFAPRDSLVRDHAASLTVNVQEALKKHGIVDRVIEREHFEQLATPVESASGIQDETRGSNDVNGTKVVDQTESDSNLCGENAVHMSSCSDDMDVDPVSMCLSPSELPSEGIFSSLRKEDGSIFVNSESFSSNNDSFIIGDRIQDYISDREFRAEMISKGVCMDVLEGSLAGSMMDIDPQPIQRPLFRCEIH